MQAPFAGRILVVDDNEMNRDVLSRRLERQGYTVAIAADGQEALPMLQEGTFDLMLLDIMMPRMNGYQVLEFMRNDSVLRFLPVIIISAVDELDSIVKCIELGAEDYLFKPFNPVLLKARVNACLEKKFMRDQLQAASGSTSINQTLVEQLSASIMPILGKVETLRGELLDERQHNLIDELHSDIQHLAEMIASARTGHDS